MNQPESIDVFIHACHQHDEQYSFSAYSYDMSNCGYIPIAKVTVPLPVISLDQIKARHLTLLRLERDEIYATAKKKADELTEQIAKLESLSYTPTEESQP